MSDNMTMQQPSFLYFRIFYGNLPWLLSGLVESLLEHPCTVNMHGAYMQETSACVGME